MTVCACDISINGKGSECTCPKRVRQGVIEENMHVLLWLPHACATHTHARMHAHAHTVITSNRKKKNSKSFKVQILASQMTRFKIPAKLISMYCIFLICKAARRLPSTRSYCLLSEQVTLPTYASILYFLLLHRLEWNSDVIAMRPSHPQLLLHHSPFTQGTTVYLSHVSCSVF